MKISKIIPVWLLAIAIIRLAMYDINGDKTYLILSEIDIVGLFIYTKKN